MPCTPQSLISVNCVPSAQACVYGSLGHRLTALELRPVRLWPARQPSCSIVLSPRAGSLCLHLVSLSLPWLCAGPDFWVWPLRGRYAQETDTSLCVCVLGGRWMAVGQCPEAAATSDRTRACLKQQECILGQFWGPEVQNRHVGKAGLPSGALGEDPLRPLAAPGGHG